MSCNDHSTPYDPNDNTKMNSLKWEQLNNTLGGSLSLINLNKKELSK
jgi:hypothetical protein